MSTLTFKRLTEVNIARCNRWHTYGINGWSPERWLAATMGELGEASNALKKLWRVQDGMKNVSEAGRQINNQEEAIAKIAEETADTFIYLNLFNARLGIDSDKEIVAKFNSTSKKYGFPERL
jgi:NTP pyrophosphatase (non-canonical NTP hydrolase)